MPTASVPLDLAYSELRTDADQTDLPGLAQSVMLKVLDLADREYNATFRRHATEQTFKRKGEYGIDLVSNTTLDEDTTTSTTDFDVDDGTKLSTTAGAGAIYDSEVPDIFEHTAPSGNNIPGVTGLNWAHEDGDTVIQLYPLPSTFHSFRSEERSPDGVILDNALALEFTSSPPENQEFSVYDNGTTKFMWLPRFMTGTVRITYNKEIDTIDDVGDTIDVFDEEHIWFHVWKLVAHGKRARGDNIQQMQTTSGKMMDEYDYKANQILMKAHRERNIGRHVRTRPIRSFQIHDLYSDKTLFNQ